MLSEHVPFYDNAEHAYDELGRRNVDRLYCFAVDDFSDDDWRQLGEGYERLPGWLGPGTEGSFQGCPCWFGLDPAAGSHLSASVEPPGIQVAGRLTDDELSEWHESFLLLTRLFPRA